VNMQREKRNRFNGFLAPEQTVETVCCQVVRATPG
jgi:hypothetical protein